MSSPTSNFSPVTPKTIIAVGTVLPLVAATAVSLRFYVRIAKAPPIGLDDWLIFTSLILAIGLGIMMIVGSAMGALAQPTPPGDGPYGFMYVINDAIITTEKMIWAFNLTQVLIFGTMKLSVVLFYRRIFRGKTFDICSKTILAIVAAWTLSFFLTIMFPCRTNFWALWSTLNDLLTHCTDDEMYLKAMSISDVITDALIIAMPLPIIWKLQLSPARKLAVSAVFLLGALAVAAGITRLVIFVDKLSNSYSSPQGILIISTWMYWSMIEIGISITAACLPTLRPLFGKSAPEGLSKVLAGIVSLRSITSSIFTKAQSTKPHKTSEGASTSSHTGLAHTVKEHDIATEIYAMGDLEAQAHMPPGRIMVHNKISRLSSPTRS